MHPSARGPRKNASQTAMSNQQTVDIFKLIRDSPSAIAMQESIDTIPSSAWKSCCAYRFFFPQPQNLTSPNLWISSTAPIELQDCFQPLSLNFWRVILRISPHSRRTTRLTLPNNEPSHLLIDPGGPYYLSRHFHNTAKSFSLSCTSHHPGLPLHTSQAKTKLAKNSAGLRLSVRVDFGGHGMAQDPLSTVEQGEAPNTSGHFPPIKSTIGGCGIPQGLLNLHRAYGSARSWTVPLLIARPAQPQTMFLDRFSLIESLIGGRGILQDLSKTFEH
ncbi:hypothetical protein D6D05_07673 [Aureobasidium pullulans]|nr:hypothetical protein D6D05_07673 [Aureobasidium pullulans]